MNERLCLFFAGYCVYAPALYYHQLALLTEFDDSAEPPIKDILQKVSTDLAEAHYEPVSNLRTASNIARFFDLTALQEPEKAQDYFEWREHLTGQFEQQFPMSRIDHYYFLYARKLSEIYANIGFAEKLVAMKKQFTEQPELDRKIHKCLKDSEFILFKLIAAAALLSSEPRQNCFNVHYKQLSKDFEKFSGIEPSELNVAQLTELEAGLAAYKQEVLDAVKNCVGVLKELGV